MSFLDKDSELYNNLTKEKDAMIDTYVKLVDTIIQNNNNSIERDIKRDRNRTIITVVGIICFSFLFLILLCYTLTHV